MKVGDLVRHGDWCTKPNIGIILEIETTLRDVKWCFVMWSHAEPEWEENIELVLMS